MINNFKKLSVQTTYKKLNFKWHEMLLDDLHDFEFYGIVIPSWPIFTKKKAYKFNKEQMYHK